MKKEAETARDTALKQKQETEFAAALAKKEAAQASKKNSFDIEMQKQ